MRVIIIFLILVVGIVTYWNLTKSKPQPNPLPTPTQSTPQKTLIKPPVPGTYVNKEYKYTVEYPKDWDLYSEYSQRSGEEIVLYHSKCKGEAFLSDKVCANVTLPHYVGTIGWGYGNKKQEEKKITLKNNVQAEKTTFYYDDFIQLSWIFDVETPPEVESLVAFADVNEKLIPGSLETVDKIINSLRFNK